LTTSKVLKKFLERWDSIGGKDSPSNRGGCSVLETFSFGLEGRMKLHHVKRFIPNGGGCSVLEIVFGWRDGIASCEKIHHPMEEDVVYHKLPTLFWTEGWDRIM
jgi:hypothetical protein